MKVVISRAQNLVLVDDKPLWVDCRALPAYVQVIQWDGGVDMDSGEGWIEFVNDHKGQHLANVKITDLSPYTFLVEKWHETKFENDAKAKAVAEANADAKADGPAALAHVRGIEGAGPEWTKDSSSNDVAARVVSGSAPSAK